MRARKLLLLMLVSVISITGLGYLLAEDLGPNQPPLAAKAPEPQLSPTKAAPVSAVPSAPMQPANVHPGVPDKPGEKQVVIEGVCVRLPLEFCVELGLGVAAGLSSKSNILSRRETKMLNTLLRLKPEYQVLTRPQICVADEQTGYFEAGTYTPYVSSSVAGTDGGKNVETTSHFPSPAYKLQVTAKICKDSHDICLGVEIKTTQTGKVVLNPRAEKSIESPVFQIETVTGNVNVPDGGSVLFCQFPQNEDGTGKSTQLLWLLTPHVMQSKQ